MFMKSKIPFFTNVHEIKNVILDEKRNTGGAHLQSWLYFVRKNVPQRNLPQKYKKYVTIHMKCVRFRTEDAPDFLATLPPMTFPNQLMQTSRRIFGKKVSKHPLNLLIKVVRAPSADLEPLPFVSGMGDIPFGRREGD
ncbi:hypothetical protein CDAR_508761 [Caerostris darwini]|uniref:Uncharacterized protein n=1 Tax=Caerostris darwini TaxID=1538125 RepID=A0AAV4N083_9ARAC|nr:hypothetical protein CDAR_508761 [Caerostris darwini]